MDEKANADQAPNEKQARANLAMTRYRKLMDDYFPSSRHSSSAVKLAACLTEASMIWDVSGAAILASTPDGRTLQVLVSRGGMPRGASVPTGDKSLVSASYARGKHFSIPDMEGQQILVGGPAAASAACIAIKSGHRVHGVLALWSDSMGRFSDQDITPLSLFGSYLAMLIEVDELGEQLGENILVDPLTGLKNRAQFEMRLHEEVSRAGRYNLQVSLLVVDIDHLEDYNRACGHMMGNLALSDIASILDRGTREVDFVSRIGSDEFGVILPETHRLGAVKLAERLRDAVASYPFPAPEGETAASITVSIGVASFPSAAKDEREMLDRAYVALRLAKSQGQGVKLWEEKDPVS